MSAQPAVNEDLELKRYEQVHSQYIKQIKVLDDRMDSLAPYEIAKLEYLYTKAERIAWNIAGFYKKQYKYYEGMAEISQGLEYKAVRKGEVEEKMTSGVDGQYLSRISKGRMLTQAAEYEGDFLTWKGVAGTYERAANALKDIMKAIEKQGGE